MGAELSRTAASDQHGVDLVGSTHRSTATGASAGGSLRRVGSSGSLEQQPRSHRISGGSGRSNSGSGQLKSTSSATALPPGEPTGRRSQRNSRTNLGGILRNTWQTAVPRRNSMSSAARSKAVSSGGVSGANGAGGGNGATGFMFSSMHNSASTSNLQGMVPTRHLVSTPDGNGSATPSVTNEEFFVESLDLPMVEWEGYVTKRGHLVRNWKTRFFTLEGNHLSYYENKEDARNRSHLKGRVNVTKVRLEKTSKSGHGFDFSFETAEGKSFLCSVPTAFDQFAWVYYMEAGIDCSNMRKNSRPIYGTYHYGIYPTMQTAEIYDLYKRVLSDENDCIRDFLAFFNKDLVFSCSYPKHLPFTGDFFGCEGLLHFLGCFRHNVELVEFSVSDVRMDADGSSCVIKGHEKLKSKITNTVIHQPWTHRIRYGPYGRILRLRVDIDVKMSTGDWSAFGAKNPYTESAVAAVRSIRSLSISLKDFTVYNVIGKGGFGTVVNAVKKSDGQIYALKILEKSKMTKYDIESSFTEMRVAQSVHHPFIAGLRIAFQSRTKLFLGMNYYGGGDLFHHMSKGPSCRIDPKRAHFYTAELVLGIHHLHQHNILYRDIKPENVMIDADGHIALVDFGLAKLHVSNYKGAKTMAGSPQYTAPELLLPKAKRSYGKAADWWSLGILLYEMSVGRSPFYDSNIEKMYQKIQKEQLSFPEKPQLSAELKDILRGFLQKDPTMRLGSNIGDILEHKYFADVDWDLLLQKRVDPPWKPRLSSPLDVEYVDTEFVELDVHSEVQSPTERSAKSKGFLSNFVPSRKEKKPASPIQDPTFKDFTYFCEDPDALVEVDNLVGELHPSRDASESSNEDLQVEIPEPTGTPLCSFVESGHLNSYVPAGPTSEIGMIPPIPMPPSVAEVTDRLEKHYAEMARLSVGSRSDGRGSGVVLCEIPPEKSRNSTGPTDSTSPATSVQEALEVPPIHVKEVPTQQPEQAQTPKEYEQVKPQEHQLHTPKVPTQQPEQAQTPTEYEPVKPHEQQQQAPKDPIPKRKHDQEQEQQRKQSDHHELNDEVEPSPRAAHIHESTNSAGVIEMEISRRAS